MEQTMGKRIVANRKRLGMTQDQLAERLGITAQAVSKWENDQSCPDITMLPKLAEIFGISTDELLGMDGVCGLQRQLRRNRLEIYLIFFPHRIRRKPIPAGFCILWDPVS